MNVSDEVSVREGVFNKFILVHDKTTLIKSMTNFTWGLTDQQCGCVF